MTKAEPHPDAACYDTLEDARLSGRAERLAADYLPHAAWLRRWLAQRFPNEPDLEDIIQESFERILTRTDLGAVENRRAYLDRTAYLLLMSRLRRQAIIAIDSYQDLEELGLACPFPLPDAVAEARDQLAHALGAIARLPDRTRDIIRLRRFDELPQRDTSERVGLTESAVEKHLRRGLRAERAELDAELPV